MNSVYMCCFSMLPDCYGLRPGREAWDSEEKKHSEGVRQTDKNQGQIKSGNKNEKRRAELSD